MHKLLLSSIVAIAVLSPVWALPVRPGIILPQPAAAVAGTAGTVTVIGHSELKVRPDIAYVSLQVITQSRDQTEAVQTNAIRTQAVRDTLTASGLAVKDMRTDYYQVSPQYDYQANPPVLTGYQVVNATKITLHDMSKTGLIIDKAVSAGATEVGGVTFDLADRHKSQGLALVEAVSDAASKADLIAGAAGVRIGRLLSVSEGTAPVVQPIFAMRSMAMATPAASPPETPISAQDITVTADITATYAIDYSK